MQRDLIFDLGLHHGLDSKFYLDKGFRVVALEANPKMIDIAKQNLGEYIASGRLTIVDKALWNTFDDEVSFYVNDVKDDWSSLFKGWAEKGGHEAQEIRVRTVTLSDLFREFGVPYYVKCDIEGADTIFVQQLMKEEQRPAFASVEAMSLETLSNLVAAGYDRVQFVNQAFHGMTKPPSPPLEGEYVDVRFNGHMSGLFGRELPSDKWIDFTTAARRYLAFIEPRNQDPLLAHGWCDFHVTTQSALVE